MRKWLSVHPAVFSLAALVTSLLVLFHVDDKNDEELILAQCEVTANAVNVTRSAFVRLAESVPGESEVEINFLAYISECLPVHDCSVSIAAPAVPDHCTVAPSVPVDE